MKGTRNERISDDLPFDSRAGISIQHYFPVDGEYVFKIRIPGPPVGENDPEIDPYQVRVPRQGGTSLGRRHVAARKSEGRKRRPGPGAAARRSRRRRAPGAVSRRSPSERRARQAIRCAGRNTRRQAARHRRTLRHVWPRRHREPLEDLHVRPKTAKEEAACARTILTTLARRAFRRPVTPPTSSRSRVLRKGRGDRGGDFDAGIQRALEAMLVSPDFLFRVEQDPPTRYSAGKAYRDHRPRARVASVVFPVEQHSRRSAAGSRRTGPAEESCRAAAASAAHAGRPARPKRSSRTSPGNGCTCATSRRRRPIRSSSRSTRRCARRS